MKTIVLWFVLAAVMAGAVIYTHAGLLTLAIAFLAWCGGVVSDRAALVVTHRADGR